LPAGDFIAAMGDFITCQPAISFLASWRFHFLPAGDFIAAMGDFIPCQPAISFLASHQFHCCHGRFHYLPASD
jgi:hypothetical protein